MVQTCWLRRVGGEVETHRRQVPGEIEVDDAGLDPGDPVVGVDLEDPVHLGHGDHDRRAERDGPAGEAGPGAARYDTAPVCGGDPHDRLHLGGVDGKADRPGHPAVEHRSVVAEQGPLGRIESDTVRRQCRLQLAEQSIVVGRRLGPETQVAEAPSYTAEHAHPGHPFQAGGLYPGERRGSRRCPRCHR